MNETPPITVLAAEVSTGIILNSDLAWYNEKSGKEMWKQTFVTEGDANTYCENFVEHHPDVELSIRFENKELRRVIHSKWRTQ